MLCGCGEFHPLYWRERERGHSQTHLLHELLNKHSLDLSQTLTIEAAVEPMEMELMMTVRTRLVKFQIFLKALSVVPS